MGLGSFSNTCELVKLVSLRLLCTFFLTFVLMWHTFKLIPVSVTAGGGQSPCQYHISG